MNKVARVFFVAAWKIAPMMKAAPAIIMDLSTTRHRSSWHNSHEVMFARSHVCRLPTE